MLLRVSWPNSFSDFFYLVKTSNCIQLTDSCQKESLLNALAIFYTFKHVLKMGTQHGCAAHLQEGGWDAGIDSSSSI
jgi:hypothetical protein